LDNLAGGHETWLARFRHHIESDDSFISFRVEHPLVASFLLAFFGRADQALGALSVRADVPAAQRLALEMGELYSWLKNASPPLIDKETSGTWAEMLRVGVPMEYATKVLLGQAKRGRGKPVSNRSLVLLAVEQKRLKPRLSWMKLTGKFCPCGQANHDTKCRERLRHQAQELEDVIARLGVEKSPEFPTR
jgi:hypothetical protein